VFIKVLRPSSDGTQGQVEWIEANVTGCELKALIEAASMSPDDMCQRVTKRQKVEVGNVRVNDAEDTISVTAEASDSQSTFSERPPSALLIAVQIRREILAFR